MACKSLEQAADRGTSKLRRGTSCAAYEAFVIVVSGSKLVANQLSRRSSRRR